MRIHFYTVGGTIDKIYFDSESRYEVGESLMDQILAEANVTVSYRVHPIRFKGNLEMRPADRRLVVETVAADPVQHIVLTHGTGTMVETARDLMVLREKTIVLTGAMSPARFRSSDAVCNIGCAVAAEQALGSGVHITMNGRISAPDRVRKNVAAGRFERI